MNARPHPPLFWHKPVWLVFSVHSDYKRSKLLVGREKVSLVFWVLCPSATPALSERKKGWLLWRQGPVAPSSRKPSQLSPQVEWVSSLGSAVLHLHLLFPSTDLCHCPSSHISITWGINIIWSLLWAPLPQELSLTLHGCLSNTCYIELNQECIIIIIWSMCPGNTAFSTLTYQTWLLKAGENSWEDLLAKCENWAIGTWAQILLPCLRDIKPRVGATS